MLPLKHPVAVIELPVETDGWHMFRVDESVLHAAVLRELCNTRAPVSIGGAGEGSIEASLQMVDEMNRRLVFESVADGIAIARAIQPRALWAAAYLNKMRVQLVLNDVSCLREGRRLCIYTAWPSEMFRQPRRYAQRQTRVRDPEPLARLHSSNGMGPTREFLVVDISEEGCAMLLPEGTPLPRPGTHIHRIEVELDHRHVVFTEARVQHLTPLSEGTHRIGCRWEGMPAAGKRMLRRWLASSAVSAQAQTAGAD